MNRLMALAALITAAAAANGFLLGVDVMEHDTEMSWIPGIAIVVLVGGAAVLHRKP